jgi:hypothetical protein
MPSKRVQFGGKPTPPSSIDDWVKTPRTETEPITPVSKPEDGEKTKRLTLDIPESLHRAIKSQAAQAGTTMVEMLRNDLIQKYGNTEK